MGRRILMVGAPVLMLATVGFLWLLGAWPFNQDSRRETNTDPPRQTPGQPWFEDVTKAAGITFRHFDPATPVHLIQETMGSGIAWIDYDNDGWPDLFCVQSAPVKAEAGVARPTSRLYRNNRDGTFRDVTDEVGLRCQGFGMGCAVGDFDNDGFDDLVVTFLGGIRLFHNEAAPGGGRRFVDITEHSGLTNPHWTTSCAWGDIDGDGLLDLYVCNYVEIDDKKPLICRHEKGLYYQCSPTAYPLTTHRLFRNKGNGRFEDISESSGIAKAALAPGLAVAMVDLDGDGLVDIYVANDMHPAYLFHNQGGGRFVEKALFSGCALGPDGTRVAGMGIVAADLDGSGRPSLFVTNFQNSPNVVYLNRGGLQFVESCNETKLGPPSRSKLGFGTVLLDADLDGHSDLAVANGHVQRVAMELFGEPYAQECQLFLGNGKGVYKGVTAQSGPDFVKRHVGRGLAVADYNNDGLPDLALSSMGEPVVLLRNATRTENAWISLDIVGDGKKSNRNAIGATVKIQAGGKTQHHFVVGGGSYLSASDRRLLIGLGTAATVDRVTVRYPSGITQTFTELAGRRWWRLMEGKKAAEEIDLAR